MKKGMSKTSDRRKKLLKNLKQHTEGAKPNPQILLEFYGKLKELSPLFSKIRGWGEYEQVFSQRPFPLATK